MMKETGTHDVQVGSTEHTARGHLSQLTLPEGWKQLTDKQIATIILGVDAAHLPDIMCLSSQPPARQNRPPHSTPDAPIPFERLFVPARCLVETFPVREEDAREWGRFSVQRVKDAMPFASIMDIVEGYDAENNPQTLILLHFIVGDESFTAVLHSWTQKISRQGTISNVGASMLLQCRSDEYSAYENDFKRIIASCHFLNGDET